MDAEDDGWARRSVKDHLVAAFGPADAYERLEAVGLSPQAAGRPPTQLSRSERSRAAVAWAARGRRLSSLRAFEFGESGLFKTSVSREVLGRSIDRSIEREREPPTRRGRRSLSRNPTAPSRGATHTRASLARETFSYVETHAQVGDGAPLDEFTSLLDRTAAVAVARGVERLVRARGWRGAAFSDSTVGLLRAR